MQITRDRSSFLLFSFFLSIFILTNQGSIQTSDGTSMFLVTKNIVENHRISLDLDERPNLSTKGKGDKKYSKYGLGTSIFSIPFYSLGKIAGQIGGIPNEFATKYFVSLMGSFITALTCVVIFKFSKKLNFISRESFFLSFIYGLGTMAWVYSEDLYSTTVVNLFLLTSIYLIYDFSEKTSLSSMFYAGLSLGMAVLTRYDAIITVPVILFYIAIKAKKQNQLTKILLKKTSAFFIPFLAFIFLLVIYNYFRFDTLFKSGYSIPTNVLFGENLLNGLYRSLLSPGRSFFVTNPILAFSLFGFIKLYREKKEEGLLFILIVIIYTLFYAKIGREYYYGGTVWGPRYLIVILPYCVMVLGFLLIKIREVRKPTLNIVFGMVLIISIMMQVSSVSVSPMRYFYEMQSFYPKNYNEKITLDPRYSLIIGQWKSLSKVLSNMADTTKLKKMVALTKAQKNFTKSSTNEILENALAINVPNFWWVYAWLYGIPKWMILSSLSILLSVIVITGKKIFYSLNFNAK